MGGIQGSDQRYAVDECCPSDFGLLLPSVMWLRGYDIARTDFDKNKEAFIHDEAGIEDYTHYDIANAMLSYMTANSSSINDGINYVDGCIDVKKCRDTFEMIFRHMEQEQHYDMMMDLA